MNDKLLQNKPVIIIHLITTLDTGGAEVMLYNLLSEMDSIRFQNQVISLTGIGPVGGKIADKGIPVHALKMPHGRITFSGIIKLWRILYTVKPAILQTWLYHADLLGLVLGKLAGIKNICWNIRCSYMALEHYRIVTKWTVKLCSFLSIFPKIIITNSNAARKFHVKLGYRSKGWQVIPNGFNLKIFRPDKKAREKLLAELGLCKYTGTETGELKHGKKAKSDTRFFLIGMIARYDPMKDHKNFFNAACLILQQRKNVHFVLAGKNVSQKNEKITAQIPRDYKKYFHLLGERSEIEEIMPAFDIITSSSSGESFPNTIGEAMSCGVSCVVTDVGDSAKIVGNTGYVVSPENPEALAMAWDTLLNMEDDKRYYLGLEARKRVMDKFNLSRIVKNYEALYSSMTV